jgi:hypothetical protein
MTELSNAGMTEKVSGMDRKRLVAVMPRLNRGTEFQFTAVAEA